MVVLRGHHGLFPFHLFHDVRPVVGLCPFTFQDAAIEISEVGTVEIERRRAVRVRMLQVGTRPVEHGHEIVAHRLDACLAQIGQAHDVILYQAVAVRAAVLDALAHRQAFHHRPTQAGRRDVIAHLHHGLVRPDFPVRDVMQSRHDAFHANLAQHGQRNLVFFPEPSPSFFHIFFFL